MKLTFALVIFASFALASAEAASAASCSSWKGICHGRAGGSYCDSMFNACMSSGCWTEGKRYGGATHCGLTKK
jgi:hypothetical protein